jgi:hypothetical protein
MQHVCALKVDRTRAARIAQRKKEEEDRIREAQRIKDEEEKKAREEEEARIKVSWFEKWI